MSMSFWDFFKGRTHGSAPAPLVKAPSPIRKNDSMTSDLIIRPDLVPPEIRSLLWFYDGPYKNYTDQAFHRNKVEVGDFVIEISFMGSQEPSAISMSAPVMQPINIGDVPRPSYYPSYMQIAPDQRWIYLNWLKNVDTEIDIGYVFIFYYGLERHLYFGNYEQAFRMILRLRAHHRNSSFQGYSANALAAASFLHKRADLLEEYLQSIDAANENRISSLFLVAKRALGLGLSPKEIMAMKSSSNRYMKEENELFTVEVRKLLLEHFGSETISLAGFSLQDCPKHYEFFAANYSLAQENRGMDFPELAKHPELSQIINGLLTQAQKNTKATVAAMKKNGTYLVGLGIIKTPVKPDPVFDKSIFFPIIDVHRFDENENFYIRSICPNCKEEMRKRLTYKGKCPLCGKLVLVKSSVFTKAMVLLTEEEHTIMAELWNERSRRIWLKEAISATGLRDADFLAFMQQEKLPLEKALLLKADIMAYKHKGCGDYGLYRNALWQKGNLHERFGETDEALKLYLAVCHLDNNGCMNSGMGFLPKHAFLAPGVINTVTTLAEELGYKRPQVRKVFLETAIQYSETGMPVSPERSWGKLGKALYQDS